MAEPRITITRGWSQLTNTLGKKAPDRLFASQRARQALKQLTRGKGH